MSTFHYFLCDAAEAEVRQEWPAVRSRYGLDGVLSDVESVPDHAVPCQVSSGPDGRAGVLLTPKRGDDGELPAVLTWQPAMQWLDRGHGCMLCWAEVPSPEWLIRRRSYPGYLVTDESGRRWSVPIIRGPGEDDFGSLPRVYSFSADGTPTPQLSPGFADLWEMACLVHDCYMEERQVESSWLLQQSVVSLGVNHRIGYPEANAFLQSGRPLISDSFAMRVLHSIIDIQAQIEYRAAKKKDVSPSGPAGSSSTRGDTADCDTAPVSVS